MKDVMMNELGDDCAINVIILLIDGNINNNKIQVLHGA